MTNFKLNLKGQFSNSQTAVNPTEVGPATVNRRSRLMSVLCLFALLTLGVGNVWATRTFKSGDVIYFKDTWKANGNSSTWKSSEEGATLCAYFFGDGEAWVNCTNTEEGSWNQENTIYKFTVPNSNKNYTTVIFTRGKNTNSWTNVWNQTTDQTPDDSYNIFYISNTKSGDKYTGTWGRYSPNGAVVGDFNSWNPDANPFGSGSTSTINVSLSSSSNTSFKILYKEAYYGNTGTITNSVSNWVFETSKDNCTITPAFASSAQNYSFKWENSTKKISVTYPTSYTITYGVGTNKGCSSVSVSPSFTSGRLVVASESITFSKTATNSGYSWKGWYNAAGGSGTNWQSTDANYTSNSRTGNVNVYACYDLINYNITYNLNGGSGASNSTYNVTTSTITLPTAPTVNKTGYTFDGWYFESNFSGTRQTQITKGSTGDKAYYAKWDVIWYTITYELNGGSKEGIVPWNPDTYSVEQNVTINVAPTKEGYDFDGWYTNDALTTPAGSPYAISIGSTGNKTFYAKWTPKTTTLSFSQSGTGYGSGGQTGTKTATYGSDMPTPISIPTAAAGYCFMGYYDALEPLGTKYYNSDGTSAHVWDKTVATTLYAYFKKAEIVSFTGMSAAYQPGATVSATANISPSPAGTTIICWRVLHDNDTPLDPQPGFTPPTGSGSSISFPAMATSGNYKLEATLRTGDACGGGTELSTYSKVFNVAGSHDVTILYKHGDVVIKTATVQSIAAYEATAIAAPDIVGFNFSSWTLGEGITKQSGNLTDANITVTAVYTSTITANYTPKRMIYFKNTLGWSGVTVYFYKNDSYWNASNGTGSHHEDTYSSTPFSESKYGAMTQIEGTDIWYFDAEGAGVNASYTNVAFTEDTQYDYHFFYDTKVARRGDYKSSLPMFVPLAQTPVSMNDGHAKYYNQGYWMNYPENTGYKLRIYPAWNSDNASGASREYYFPYSADLQMPLKLDVELNTTEKIWFMVYRNDNVLIGKNYSVTQDNHETKLDKPSTNKLELNPSAPGVYSFTLSFHDNGGSPKSYDYYINVDYPVSVGDYRIYYTDNATWSQGSAHGAGWAHPSDIIRKNTGSEAADTVSLFVSYGSSPSAKFQYVSAIEGSTVTWTNVAGGTIDLSGITKKGVYNFIVSQPAGGESIELSKTEEYTGNFYIRTDCAGNTKWDNFRTRDHQMTYTEFSMSDANSFGDKFSHYFAHWCPAGTNVKFCVANDYSVCISDTLTQDVGDPFSNIDIYGNLKSDGNADATANIYSANIRFMYNETTNKISRAYVSAASNKSRQFLVLKGNNTLLNEDESALSGEGESAANHEAIFVDNENFIYERILKIIPGTRFKLYACYAKNPIDVTKAQYFRGQYDDGNFTSDENSVVLLSGSGDAQKLRVIYDFKTNRLVAAWMPSTTDVSGVLKIDADVMVLRDHQEAAECITFANGESKLDGVKTVYGAMKFNRWTLNNRYRGEGGVEDNNKDHCDTPEDITRYHGILPSGSQKSIYERSLYFISFPFNVKVSEIFGFGHYWDEWYLEYYDGETRAKNGYWLDSPPNWKYVTPEMAEDYVLEAYKGYILGLDLDYMGYDNTTFWANNISNVELYFPSQTTMSSIKQTEVTIPALGEEYRCTINRGTPEGDRRIKDSFWRCIGVPSYNEFAGELKAGSSSGSTITWQTNENQFPFLYVWNMTDNTLTAQSTSTFSFKPMHAYLVQIQDAIYWNMVSATPASIVARRVAKEAESEYNWRLEISKDSTFVDQTYVRMSNIEQVTDTFDFGQDLVKELNTTRSNIYTFVGYERLAANSMPLETEQTTIVPLGLNIKTAGDYTFAMPDGTNGVGVTLVDTEANVRTSLSALDYTVSLEAGEYTGRFVLEISPVQNTPTGLEEPTSNSSLKGRAQKRIIDGVLYIVRDGKIFDARGARVE